MSEAAAPETPATPDPDAARERLRENIRQFGETARGYAVSRTHTEGGTRHLLIERLQPVMDETVLDVACGAGGMTLAIAPYVHAALGLDPAPEMLGALRLGARRAEIGNVTPIRGDAHHLPLRDRAVQIVTVRMAPHHFHDVAGAVREMARVLDRGGRLGIADGAVPEDPELDAFINRLDTLHDPTTVRNYNATEWRGWFEAAGLRVDSVEEDQFDLPEGRLLSEWVARSAGSSVVFEECRRLLLGAPLAVRRALRVQAEGNDVRFDLPKIVIVGKRVD